MNIISRFVLAVLVVLLATLGGCSSEPGEQTKDAPTEALDSNYAITAYLPVGGDVETVSFRQVAASDVASQSAPLTTKGITLDPAETGTVTSSMKDLARVALSECGLRRLSQRPAAPTTTDPSRSCVAGQFANGIPYERKRSSGTAVPDFTYSDATIEPSCTGLAAPSAQPFLFFGYEPRTAAQVLQYEETLVCAASKLAELADAEKPLTWTYGLYGLRYSDGTNNVVDLPGSKVSTVATVPEVIPPITFRVVQPKDKFLVRDLAMELLSYVPLLDQLPIPVTIAAVTSYYTASGLFTDLVVDRKTEKVAAAYNQPMASITATNASLFYPQIDVAGGAVDWDRTARRHLEMETANLRAAGQLMADLIEKNVYGALGGAAQKAAKLPPAERGPAFWADGTDGNSIAEIGRVLFGRLGTLGMGGTGLVSTTNCTVTPPANTTWTRPEEAWTAFAPLSFQQRGTDVRFLTRSARTTSNLLDSARFVPIGTATVATVREEMFQHLAKAIAAENGLSQATLEARPLGIQLRKSLNTTPDGEINNAVARQAATLRTMSNAQPGVPQLAALGYAPLPTGTGNGQDLNSTTQRDAYTGDLFAPLAPVQTAAECTGTPTGTTTFATARQIAEGNPVVSVANALSGTAAGRGTGPFTPRLRSYQFQNPFAVGQALRDRLVRLREGARLLSNLGLTTDEDVKARTGGLFELDAWAGGTRVIVTPDAPSAGTFTVSLFDLDLKDYGLPDPPTTTDLMNAFAFAVAPQSANDGDASIVAQCASGTRVSRCPSTVNASLWKPNGVVTTTQTAFKEAALYGRLRKRYDLTFLASAGPNAITTAGSAAGIAKVAKILIRLPSGANSPGRVLGTAKSTSASTTAADNVVTFPVSPLQRKLVEAVFGFPKANDDLTSTLADTREYCIPGVPRDVFVPLENELTSDGDAYESSWKHYLTNAKQAAAHADDLGRELIDIGTRIEERKEGQSDIAEGLLGGPFDKACIQAAADGDEDFGKCSDSINAVLSDSRLDIVLLSDDPTPAKLSATLGCSTLPASVLPKACTVLNGGGTAQLVAPSNFRTWRRPAGSSNIVFYGALGLVRAPPVPKVTPAECTPAPYNGGQEAYLAPTYPPAPDGAAVDPKGPIPGSLRWSGSDSNLRQVVRQSRLIVDNDANFRLENNGTIVMDTRIQTTGTDLPWPSCLRASSPGNPDPAIRCGFDANPTNANAPLNKALQALFRSCPASNAVLGSCNGTDEWQEMAGIRWRVMGALWTAASLAGGAPEGMFELPIPAVNFPAVTGGLNGSVCALPVTVYGTARFVQTTNGYLLTGSSPVLNAPDFEAMTALGPNVAIDPHFEAMPQTVNMPTWYRHIYSKTTTPAECYTTTGSTDPVPRYVHVRARTAAVVSDTTPLTSWLNANGPAGVAGVGLKLDGWRTLARNTNSSLFPRMLASVKTWFDPTSPGAAFYHDHFAPDYFMVGLQYRDQDRFGPGGPSLGDEYPTEYRWTGSGGSPPYYGFKQWDCTTGARDQFGYCAFTPGEGLPSTQPPSIRARFFVNSLAPYSATEAPRQFGEAMALSCVLSLAKANAADTELPPQISNVGDLGKLRAWLGTKSRVASESVGRLWIQDVPMVVIDAARSDVVGAGPIKGQIGVTSVEASAALRAVGQSYFNASFAITQSEGELSTLQGSLDLIDKEKEVQNVQAILRGLENARTVANSVGNIFTLDPARLVGGIVAASVNAAGTGAIELADLLALQPAEAAVADQKRLNAIVLASRQILVYRKNQIDALADVRDKLSVLQAKLLLLEQQKKQLAGALHKATGAGAWSCSDADNNTITCRSYVNTVLNTRYSGTRIRYEQALIAARTAGYYARRAVEQRLGVRLDALEAPIGPLEAPAKWADRVCTMHGVDFDSLKKEDVIEDPAQRRAWQELKGREYANSFIGDYVELLSNFVELYNVAYPSQDGNDTLLLSMREDVQRQPGACAERSVNRLWNTEAIAPASPVPVGDGAWEVHFCATSDTKCLNVRKWARSTRYDVSAAPPPVPRVDAGTWLSTRPRYNTALQPEQGIDAPSGFVSQAVVLPAGPFALSFKDVAINPATGNPDTATASPYRASILDEAGAMIATEVFMPALSSQQGYLLPEGGILVYRAVGTRRTIKFNVPSSGRYRIAFAAAPAPGLDGSVLIAEPQVERDVGTAPTDYQATNAEGLAQSSNCASTPDQLRARFVRKCDSTASTSAPVRCYYEATAPFVVDTEKLTVNGMSLADKLAADNFNYRHVDFALNLVGTGLRSCDENPTPGCYANGTLEYDIVHEANQVGIVGYDREARRFDFGEGAIRHGKALTAERYLTLPLSGADTSLLSGTGITKTELRGRPLDGRYRVRIYESPALRWSNLEDIQLMIRYRYWSRVTSPTP